MKRRAVSIGLVALVVTFVSTGAGHAAATLSDKQSCPFPGGADADYLGISDPLAMTIPADGASHTVSVFASEEEAAPNTVTLALAATAQDTGGSTSTTPYTANSQGAHETTAQLSLPGIPGRVYTINWAVAFDFGVHPCASAQPGFHPFTVTVGP